MAEPMNTREDLKRYHFVDISVLLTEPNSPLVVLHMADNIQDNINFLERYINNHSIDFSVGKNNNGEYGFRLKLNDLGCTFTFNSEITKDNYPPIAKIVQSHLYLTTGFSPDFGRVEYAHKPLKVHNPFLNLN